MASYVAFKYLKVDALADYLSTLSLYEAHNGEIHKDSVLSNQVPSNRETYLPVSLAWDDGPDVHVYDLFITDFSTSQGASAVGGGAGAVGGGAGAVGGGAGAVGGDAGAVGGDVGTLVPKTKVIIIVGPSGVGKTSLMNYLKLDWTSGEDCKVRNLNHFDMVILIEASKIKSRSVARMFTREIFKDIMSNTFKESEVCSSLREMNILWLVDGFDEASKATKIIVREMISDFPKSQTIITTRNTREKELKSMMAQLKVKFVTLTLGEMKGDTWKSMVPMMFNAKFGDSQVINNACARFIAAVGVEIQSNPEVNPGYLGLLVDRWSEKILKKKYGIPSEGLEEKASGNSNNSKPKKEKPKIGWRKFRQGKPKGKKSKSSKK